METTVNLQSQVKALEKELREKKKQLNQLRKQLPHKEVNDYTFSAPDGNKVNLSELFNDKDELMVIHNMGKGCRYCTLWADEYNGIAQHLENRIPFAVISPDEPNVMKEFAGSRNWKFRIFSSKGNTFKKDLGFENSQGKPIPGVSVFRKVNEQIFEVANDNFGPGDYYCSLWHYLDLIPEGVNGWEPQYSY